MIHSLERFACVPGTVTSIAPLLGLLGTVRHDQAFSAIMAHGSGNAALLAGGISKALITTAAGFDRGDSRAGLPSLFSSAVSTAWWSKCRSVR